MKKLFTAFISVVMSVVMVSSFAVSVNGASILTEEISTTAEYTVNYYITSSSAAGLSLYKSVKKQGNVGEYATYDKLSFFGFTERSVTKKTVSADGAAKLTVVYDADTDYSCGDVNTDGKVDMLDLAIIQRYAALWQGYDSESVDIYTADINTDGKIDTADAVKLAKYLAGNIAKPKTVAERESEWSPWA